MSDNYHTSFWSLVACLDLLLFSVVAFGTEGEIHQQVQINQAVIDTLLHQDWESGIGNWWVDNGLWQVGVPLAGPDSTCSGVNCAGTDLDGGYPPTANTRLISPNILLPDPPEGSKIQLRFWHWFQIAEDNYYGDDKGYIQISVENGEWQTLLGPISGSSLVWSPVIIDLSAFANQRLKIGFQFLSGSLVEGIGWYVDDILLMVEPVIYNNPEGFEQGIGDWWVDNGLWEAGIPAVGPESAHSGLNCAGTFLGGGYPGGSNTRLVSPPITITPQQGQYPGLYFWHWFRLAESSYYGNDKGYVQISVNGGDWLTIGGPYSGISTVWSQSYVDLFDYIDSTVKIAFYLTSGTLIDDVGWYVDDIRIEGIVTDADDRNNTGMPYHPGLSQNYPNPFNPSTTIRYSVPRKSMVTIEIFNILGEKITTLVNESKPAGEYRIAWDGSDINGVKVATGIYFYRLRSGDFVEMKKMLLIK